MMKTKARPKKSVKKTPAKKPPAKKKPRKKPAKKTFFCENCDANPIYVEGLCESCYAHKIRETQTKLRCEKCNAKFWPDELVEAPEGHWCHDCNTRWYVVAINPEATDSMVAKKIRQRARDAGLAVQVLEPRHKVIETAKTTWRVWRDSEALDKSWQIPDGENDRDVLREHGLLGFVTADTEDQAWNYSRKKYGDYPERIIELHNPGGKPKCIGRPKYKGYLAIRCEWSHVVDDLIHKTTDVIGVLPIRPNPYSGFKYPRKEPKQKRKPQLWELEARDEWSPTPMDTETEVETLLAEKALMKNTPSKIEFKFPVGTPVKIINGQWSEAEGVVDAVSQENPPKLVVRLKILGRDVLAKTEMWQVLKLESY